MFPTEPVPERISAYKIVRRAPGVGSAKVYVARKDGPMGFARLYTLKLVPNTSEGDARFVEELTREAAICSSLNHQAIQRMIDFFEHDKDLVLVLEHIEGTTLERLLSYLEQNQKALTDAAKAYVGREIAAALVHAHAARDENGKPMPIVHRALDPEHVLLGWDGQVRLTGFGLGKILGRSPDTVVAQKNVSPGYKAPEQLRGEAITPKADVYALGLFMWVFFSGQKLSEKGIRPPKLVTVRKDLLKPVATAIDAALEPFLDKRPASCRDIEMALALVPGIESGRDELCEKLDSLRDSRPNPDSTNRPSLPSASRPRIPLQSIRPSQPAISSKERLSTVPPAQPQSIRPVNSLPPILFDDVQPKSVYPLLKALAEKVPKQDGGIPKAPRLPAMEGPPSSARGARSERAPRSGVPKLAIATPIELDSSGHKPRTEWMASVPDEEAFDKLFDEVTSRSPNELEAAGIGRGNEKSPDSAKNSRRRKLENADTIQMQAVTGDLGPNGPGDAPPSLATPPLGPPPAAKPVRFGPPPAAPAPPKLKRGFAPPPVPTTPENKRPSVVLLAVVFGTITVGVALLVLLFSDKPMPKRTTTPSASARITNSAASMKTPVVVPMASAKTTATAPASAEGPPPPLPYGQGYLTVVYPDDAMVYVSGRKLGQTNTRLQNRCGRYFVRIAKAGDSVYPEWLSAGQPVAIPCQDSIRVEISR
jgi:eukaryotic-like serine/threonine-protein kinase